MRRMEVILPSTTVHDTATMRATGFAAAPTEGR